MFKRSRPAGWGGKVLAGLVICCLGPALQAQTAGSLPSETVTIEDPAALPPTPTDSLLPDSALDLAPEPEAANPLASPLDPLLEFAPSSASPTLRPLGAEESETGGSGLSTFADSPLPGDADPTLPVAEMEETTEPKQRNWRLVPLLGFEVEYTDNLFNDAVDPVSDIILSIPFGFRLELGDFREMQGPFLSLNALGRGKVYLDYSQYNTIDQNAGLFGQYVLGQTTLQLESTYSYTNSPQREIGAGFTETYTFNNAVRAMHRVSEKTQGEFEVRQMSRFNVDYLSSNEIYAKATGLYQVTPKLQLGPEVRVGVLDSQDSPLQVYEQLRLASRYDALGKLQGHLSAGLDFRQYLSGGEPMRVAPVFSLGFTYRPLANTAFRLEGYRDYTGSASLAGQDTLRTGISFGVEQRLFQRITFDVAAGYENDEYVANETSVVADREDNYYFVRPSLSYLMKEWLQFQFFYEYRQNDSNQPANAFTVNRMGFSVTTTF